MDIITEIIIHSNNPPKYTMSSFNSFISDLKKSELPKCSTCRTRDISGTNSKSCEYCGKKLKSRRTKGKYDSLSHWDRYNIHNVLSRGFGRKGLAQYYGVSVSTISKWHSKICEEMYKTHIDIDEGLIPQIKATSDELLRIY